MLKKILLLALPLALLGCSSAPKEWKALDGSKADGKIIMAYTFQPALDTPPTNDEDATNIASSKCQAWGYSSASFFGEESRLCSSIEMDPDGAHGCKTWMVKRIYQCED
ncbi:YecR family lipoprotein [Shewanella colwelliana]|uniref:YecR family lipoprotein n=1 Tax=Shewanella colwelliana TaxID=23 RepID=UPI0037363362